MKLPQKYNRSEFQSISEGAPPGVGNGTLTKRSSTSKWEKNWKILRKLAKIQCYTLNPARGVAVLGEPRGGCQEGGRGITPLKGREAVPGKGY